MLTILRGTIAASLLTVATLSGGVAQAQSVEMGRPEMMQTREQTEVPWGLLGLLGLAGLTGLKRRDRNMRTHSERTVPAE